MKGGEAPNKTVDFIKKRFRGYYKDCDLYLPDRFGRREFGFMFLDSDFVQRHLNFASKREVKQFLVDRVPAHVYHSAAYYEKPGAPTMAQKTWLGSDLIFDLDADHIVGAKKMGYGEMLNRVKEETTKLIDEFLVRDFGFEEDGIIVAFSGGRGYHIHIRDPRVWGLASHERREIVDYILGTDIDVDMMFPKIPYETTRWGPKNRYEMLDMSAHGWRGKIARGLDEEVDRLKDMDRREALARLREFDGVGDSIAKEIYSSLFDGEEGKRGYDKFKKGHLDIFSRDLYLSGFTRGFLDRERPSIRGETDEPVTSDIKRLIRLPSSLHGKTGFSVILLTRSSLDDFNPLSDAVPSSWSDDLVVVRGKVKAEVQLKGETFNLKKDIVRLPEYAALFFMCRGMASLA
ncbi:MAG: DNA primase small subunit PriS [Methanobacteriota archaeon]|nr:MAG: DNA primase small subunit PriS [Euryarchaeota archaeon]